MCVACLELSTQLCRHRWYRLRHRCSPDLHLGNCANKLRLQGWETRTEHCPFCEGWPQIHEEYRLLGQTCGGSRPLHALRIDGNSTSSSSCSSCSRTPSLSRHLLHTGHDANLRNTKGSQNRWGISSESSTSIHGRSRGRHTSEDGGLVHSEVFGSSSNDTYSSLTCATGTKNRAMNKRLDIYLNSSVPRRLVPDRSIDGSSAEHSDADPVAINKNDVDAINTTRNSKTVAATGMPQSPTLAITSAEVFSNQTIPIVPVFHNSHDDWTAGMRSKQKRKGKGMNMSLGKKLGFLFLS